MFALVVPPRPIVTPATALDPTHYAFNVPSSPPFHHLVVFILPDAQFPPDAAATVHIQIPPNPEFQLLGAIGPGKESAIFRVEGVGGTNGGNSGQDGGDMMVETNDSSNDKSTADVVVGISIEPSTQVAAQLAQLKETGLITQTSQAASTGSAVPTKVLAQRIIMNAFNFLSSFGAGDTVPLKAFQDWWKKFERRVEMDPDFLEREQERG